MPATLASTTRTSRWTPARSFVRGAAALLASAALSASLVGCGQVGSSDDPNSMVWTDGTPKVERPPLGEPLTSEKGSWTWVDFADSSCDDGSPTGIAINRSDSKNLLVFLMGGGACWDYLTCAILNTSSHGPFGRMQWEGSKGITMGSVLDRSADNPFRDYNLVFVPYCTGDVHAGDNVIEYDGGIGKKKVAHKGRPNLVAFLKRIAATVPTPDKLVVSGSSAGGFGAALNYDLFRTYFPTAKQSYLIDDSGPPMIGDAIPKDLRATIWKSWKFDQTISSLCPGCDADMSALVPILAKKYGNDRMSLLSYTQDGVIRNFFGLQSGPDFEKNLRAVVDKVIEPQPNFRYYVVTGDKHTFLGAPAKTTAQGVPLWDFIKKQVEDDAGWQSTKPATP